MASRFTVFKGNSWRVDMRGWPFVIVVGLVLAAIAIIDGGGLSGVRTAGAAGTTTAVVCDFTVVGTGVKERKDPNENSTQVATLNQGQAVAATPTVINGFRKLRNGDWVANLYLTPVSGSTCA